MKVKLVKKNHELMEHPKNMEELKQDIDVFLSMLQKGDKIIVRG